MQESSRVRVSTQILFFSPFFIHDLTDRRHDRAAEAGEASRIDSTHITHSVPTICSSSSHHTIIIKTIESIIHKIPIQRSKYVPYSTVARPPKLSLL